MFFINKWGAHVKTNKVPVLLSKRVTLKDKRIKLTIGCMFSLQGVTNNGLNNRNKYYS